MQVTLLKHYAILECLGEKTLDFLQGQLSADLRQLTDSQALFSSYCDAKGRVLASLYVVSYQQRILILLPEDLQASI